ncbi:MAG: CHAP domain-containing protein [Candidatus Eremiobacterota bacterium]
MQSESVHHTNAWAQGAINRFRAPQEYLQDGAVSGNGNGDTLNLHLESEDRPPANLMGLITWLTESPAGSARNGASPGMGLQASGVAEPPWLDLARGYLGTNGWTPEGQKQIYETFLKKQVDHDWCAAFISHVVEQANGGKFPFRSQAAGRDYFYSVNDWVDWARQENRLRTLDPRSDPLPQPGDLAVFPGSEHIGIIERVERTPDGRIVLYTVEGNADEKLAPVKDDGTPNGSNDGRVARKSYEVGKGAAPTRYISMQGALPKKQATPSGGAPSHSGTPAATRHREASESSFPQVKR